MGPGIISLPNKSSCVYFAIRESGDALEKIAFVFLDVFPFLISLTFQKAHIALIVEMEELLFFVCECLEEEKEYSGEAIIFQLPCKHQRHQ